MMRPQGIRGLLDRFRDWPLRLRILAGAGIGLFLAAVLVSVLLTMSGGSGGGDAGVSGDDSDLAVDFGEADDAPAVAEASPVPEPTMTLEERVLSAVAATVAAKYPEPEPTEVPTPDVAATLAAEVAASRGGGQSGRQVNPLDAGGVRNPYLSERDVRYLSVMGEDLWVATQLYLRLAEVAARDYSRLTATYMRERLAFIDGLLAGLPEYDNRDLSSAGLNELVISFVAFVDGGIRSVERAAGEFRSMAAVFDQAGAETLAGLNAVQRDAVRQHYLELNGLLVDFYAVMSAYGCSACGGLFRSPFILE